MKPENKYQIGVKVNNDLLDQQDAISWHMLVLFLVTPPLFYTWYPLFSVLPAKEKNKKIILIFHS